uniref:Uncharacterized protein n=1 Tax=Schizaphis graminum TaxID=13262 RepID=A0A2S2P991_SCHGA
MREYKGADATAVLRRGDSCKLRAVERDIGRSVGLSAVMRYTLQYYVLICHSILTFFYFSLVFYFRENQKIISADNIFTSCVFFYSSLVFLRFRRQTREPRE